MTLSGLVDSLKTRMAIPLTVVFLLSITNVVAVAGPITNPTTSAPTPCYQYDYKSNNGFTCAGVPSPGYDTIAVKSECEEICNGMRSDGIFCLGFQFDSSTETNAVEGTCTFYASFTGIDAAGTTHSCNALVGRRLCIDTSKLTKTPTPKPTTTSASAPCYQYDYTTNIGYTCAGVLNPGYNTVATKSECEEICNGIRLDKKSCLGFQFDSSTGGNAAEGTCIFYTSFTGIAPAGATFSCTALIARHPCTSNSAPTTEPTVSPTSPTTSPTTAVPTISVVPKATCADGLDAYLAWKSYVAGGNGLLTHIECWGTENQTSTIPTTISQYSGLTSLSLEYGYVSGTLPTELGLLTSLTKLSVRENAGLSGSIPVELSNLDDLRYLFIHDNPFLTGAVPTELNVLSNLTQLLLNRNEQLTGSIPSELGNLDAKLEQLMLYENVQMTGILPVELGKLTNLRALEVSGFPLITGSIPTALGNLPVLQRLYLHKNPSLTGQISNEHGGLLELVYYNVQDDVGLTGSVPASVCNLPKLYALTLTNSGLTACVDDESTKSPTGGVST